MKKGTHCLFRNPSGRLSQRAFHDHIYSPDRMLDRRGKWLYCYHPTLHKHLHFNGYFLSVEVIHGKAPSNSFNEEEFPCFLFAERYDGDGSRKKLGRIVGVTAGMAEIERRIKAGEFDQ